MLNKLVMIFISLNALVKLVMNVRVVNSDFENTFNERLNNHRYSEETSLWKEFNSNELPSASSAIMKVKREKESSDGFVSSKLKSQKKLSHPKNHVHFYIGDPLQESVANSYYNEGMNYSHEYSSETSPSRLNSPPKITPKEEKFYQKFHGYDLKTSKNNNDIKRHELPYFAEHPGEITTDYLLPTHPSSKTTSNVHFLLEKSDRKKYALHTTSYASNRDEEYSQYTNEIQNDKDNFNLNTPKGKDNLELQQSISLYDKLHRHVNHKPVVTYIRDSKKFYNTHQRKNLTQKYIQTSPWSPCKDASCSYSDFSVVTSDSTAENQLNSSAIKNIRDYNQIKPKLKYNYHKNSSSVLGSQFEPIQNKIFFNQITNRDPSFSYFHGNFLKSGYKGLLNRWRKPKSYNVIYIVLAVVYIVALTASLLIPNVVAIPVNRKIRSLTGEFQSEPVSKCFSNIMFCLILQGCENILCTLLVFLLVFFTIEKSAAEHEVHDNNIKRQQPHAYSNYFGHEVNSKQEGKVSTLQQLKHQPNVYYHLPSLKAHPLQSGDNSYNRQASRLRSRSMRNPFSYLRSMWDETWDGTSRLLDTSLHWAKYLWAVPVLGVLAYDIFVPETVIIKRNAPGNTIMAYESIISTMKLSNIVLKLL